MSLSIFTNAASMASTNAMNKSNNLLSTAMERLGTGKRINSAADDAAGLQIATRLQGQTNGMSVAQRNISDATALLQTSEGAFDEVSNIMYRMKDLASQAANDTNTDKDRQAIDSELNELNSELGNIMKNTSYAGDKLFGANGKFSEALNFQIGSSTDETMQVNLSTELNGASGSLINANGGFNKLTASGSSFINASSSSINLTSAESAKDLMTALEGSLDEVGYTRQLWYRLWHCLPKSIISNQIIRWLSRVIRKYSSWLAIGVDEYTNAHPIISAKNKSLRREFIAVRDARSGNQNIIARPIDWKPSLPNCSYFLSIVFVAIYSTNLYLV